MKTATISESRQGQALVLQVDGPLTAGGGDMLLRSRVADALEKGERQIVLDFGLLSTLDSSGLGELMRASGSVKAADGFMAWANCPTTMIDVLTIVNVEFDDVIITESLDGAVEALASLV